MRIRRGSLFGITLCSALVFGSPDRQPVQVLTPAYAEDATAVGMFDPDVIRPQPGSALEATLKAYARGDRETARALATAGLSSAGAEEEPLLRYLAAKIARELEAQQEAAELLFPLATSAHPLARWAQLSMAELLEVKDPGSALAFVDALLAPTSDFETWPGRQGAERMRARVLAKLGRTDEAIATFERFVSDAPDDSLALQVMMPLADLLSERDDAERVRALTLYRRIANRVPGTRVGVRAEERAREVLKSLPEPMRSEFREPDLDDRLARADALLASLRYDEAAQAYAALEPRVASDPVLACRVRFGRAKALLDRRARTEGSVLMAEVAEECGHDVEQRAWARYHAGRAFSALGKNDLALVQYEALEKEAPSHRLADDALFRAAKVARDMGDNEGAVMRLSALPERYPQGDMRARARFALAWQARAQGDLRTAIQTLSLDLRDEQAEDLQGRASYWRARWLSESGDKRAAADGFAATFERVPLAYYGQLAFTRLSALDPGRAQLLASRLTGTQDGKLAFENRPELKTPGFERALALFRVGEVQLAMAELRALEFTSNKVDPELTFLAVALLDRAGVTHMAVDLARKRIDELLARAPRGRDLALYQLAYPMAYSPLIELAAAKEGVPPAFVRAAAREESGFYARAVSRAHAYGLIQILEPTARAIAKGLSLPSDPESLARPEINIALASRFISNLAASLRGQYALVPAAYNAGPAAVARWREERKDEPLDTWIENIPYDETRHYTRRVIQTYGVYTWLAKGELLNLPLDMPAP